MKLPIFVRITRALAGSLESTNRVTSLKVEDTKASDSSRSVFLMIVFFFNAESEGHWWKQCREVPSQREVLSQPNKSLDLRKALSFDLLQGFSDWRGTPKSERACTQSCLRRHTRAMLLMLKDELIHILGVSHIFFCPFFSLSLSISLYLSLSLSISLYLSLSLSFVLSLSLSLSLSFVAMDEVPFPMTKETKQDLWMTVDIFLFFAVEGKDICASLCLGRCSADY